MSDATADGSDRGKNQHPGCSIYRFTGMSDARAGTPRASELATLAPAQPALEPSAMHHGDGASHQGDLVGLGEAAQ
ncbi:MAG: hypothetical protein ABSH53_19145 [Holophaga sp.]